MSAQTRYSHSSPIGAAGGIADLAPYAIDTFLNEEDSGVLKFGVGVVSGSKPGINITLPTHSSDIGDFEGVTVNNRTTEQDLEGNLHIRKGASVGVMRFGRIYVRIADECKPEYGEPVYLIVNGDEAGCFTNEEVKEVTGEAPNQTTTIGSKAIKARFLGGLDASAKIALIELFNQAQS